MKLEPNMYVRTKTGIEQIYKIDNNKTKYKYLFKLKKQDGDGCIDCGVLSSEDITKASHNIIDLIEVGDYVNGYKVCDVDEFSERVNYIYIVDKFDRYEDENTIILYEKNIKDVLTKEQYETMSYKVV